MNSFVRSKYLLKSLNNPTYRVLFSPLTLQNKGVYSALHDKRSFSYKVHLSKFKEEKLRILEQPSTSFNSFKFIKFCMLYPTLGFLLYKLGCKIVAFKIFGIIFYGFASFGFFIIASKIIHKGGMIIRTIDLLKDGKRCLISTANGSSQIIDISGIRKFNQAEKYVYEQQLMKSLKSYVPIIINNMLYLTYIKSTIKETEIMAEISEGRYIEVTDKLEDGSQDSIDITNTIDI